MVMGVCGRGGGCGGTKVYVLLYAHLYIKDSMVHSSDWCHCVHDFQVVRSLTHDVVMLVNIADAKVRCGGKSVL